MGNGESLKLGKIERNCENLDFFHIQRTLFQTFWVLLRPNKTD